MTSKHVLLVEKGQHVFKNALTIIITVIASNSFIYYADYSSWWDKPFYMVDSVDNDTVY